MPGAQFEQTVSSVSDMCRRLVRGLIALSRASRDTTQMARSHSAFPRRAVVGLVSGLAITAGWAVVLGIAFDWSERTVVQMGAVLAGIGAVAGAVVGGVSDVLDRLRDLAPPKDGPEADYLDAK